MTEQLLATQTWHAVDHLVLHSAGDRMRVMSPSVTSRLLVPHAVAQLLLMARGGGITLAEAQAQLGWDVTRATATFALLSGHGFLRADHDFTELSPPWREWGLLAWAYDQGVSRPGTGDIAELPATANGAPTLTEYSNLPPSTFPQVADEPVLLLPRRSSRINYSFTEVLEKRRTHRRFQPLPLGVNDLSEILRTTFGPLDFADAGPLGVMQLRAAASGGARHETDVYVCVLNVAGVAPGMYLYDSLRHGLVCRGEGDWRSRLEEVTLGQGFFRASAVAFLTVARSIRMSWKYRSPGAYKVLWQNVGHLAQVLSMTSAGLDLGAAITGALRQDAIKAMLDLKDGHDIVTLAMAVGYPELEPTGRPLGVCPPRAPFLP